jgi:hypothetical protein
MSSFREHNATLICEGTPSLISFQLTNERDVPLPKDQLLTLTVTFYVSSKGPDLGQIINAREDTDILDANDGTVYDGVTAAPDGSIPATGWIEFRANRLDNALINQRRGFETHVALFKWTWQDSPDDPGVKELSFVVANQSKMP